MTNTPRPLSGITVQPVDYTGYLPFASAIGSDGTWLYVICTEGVGHRIDGDEVARMEQTGEPVDLALWIRQFGSRLEVNYRLWCGRLVSDRERIGLDELPEDDAYDDSDRCPACGEFPDYCQGHGSIGDPLGYMVLQAHDSGDHSQCLPNAACVTENEQ